MIFFRRTYKMANSLEVMLGRDDLTGIFQNYKGNYYATFTLHHRTRYIGCFYTIEQAQHARSHAKSGAGFLPSTVPRGQPHGNKRNACW